jgi:hypothetical protein
MFIRHGTGRYILSEDRHGFFHLHRIADGASAFFQGDDADLWDRNMRSLEGVKQWNAGNSLDRSFDFLCSGYDDLLKVEA